MKFHEESFKIHFLFTLPFKPAHRLIQLQFRPFIDVYIFNGYLLKPTVELHESFFLICCGHFHLKKLQIEEPTGHAATPDILRKQLAAKHFMPFDI